MSVFEPNKRHLREALLFCYNSKKSAAESHRMLIETYGETCIGETTCRDWFRRFKSGDFDVEDKERPGPAKKFEDAELEALLNEDPCRTQKELADLLGVSQKAISNRLKALGMVQKLISKKRPESEEKQSDGRPATDAVLKGKSTLNHYAPDIEKKVSVKIAEIPKRSQKRTRGFMSVESNNRSTTSPPVQKRRQIFKLN